MTEHYSEKRRTFLKTIILLGGSVASLTMVKGEGKAATAFPAAPDISGKSYRETDHIRKYYQTARS